MTDIVPEFIIDEPDDQDPPLPFKLTFTVAGEKQSEEFTALPRSHAPYWWVVDYFAAGEGDATAQAVATLALFERVLVAHDAAKDRRSSRERFFALVRDPAIVVHGKALQQIATYLLAEYSRVDPTSARSAGQPRSPGGRSATSRGSTAPRSARAST